MSLGTFRLEIAGFRNLYMPRPEKIQAIMRIKNLRAEWEIFRLTGRRFQAGGGGLGTKIAPSEERGSGRGEEVVWNEKGSTRKGRSTRSGYPKALNQCPC